jgi:hypothetical protein
MIALAGDGMGKSILSWPILRIRRVPPYVFDIFGELKGAVRKRGKYTIDLGTDSPGGARVKTLQTR